MSAVDIEMLRNVEPSTLLGRRIEEATSGLPRVATSFGEIRRLCFVIRDVEIDDRKIRISAVVCDRLTDRPLVLDASFDRCPGVDLVDELRAALIAAFAHEVDECLQADGRPARDPHLSSR